LLNAPAGSFSIDIDE
jgi:cold shock protein